MWKTKYTLWFKGALFGPLGVEWQNRSPLKASKFHPLSLSECGGCNFDAISWFTFLSYHLQLYDKTLRAASNVNWAPHLLSNTDIDKSSPYVWHFRFEAESRAAGIKHQLHNCHQYLLILILILSCKKEVPLFPSPASCGLSFHPLSFFLFLRSLFCGFSLCVTPLFLHFCGFCPLSLSGNLLSYLLVVSLTSSRSPYSASFVSFHHSSPSPLYSLHGYTFRVFICSKALVPLERLNSQPTILPRSKSHSPQWHSLISWSTGRKCGQ